jgi:hypothetical protein
MTDREKALIDLHKHFLLLNYKISKYEMAKLTPPEYLLKKIKEVGRQIRIVSKALE